MEKYTEQQIEQLAPDNNLKSAKSLVKSNKWPDLGISGRALWGLCQGSGKNPYKVAIDTTNLAFKCSCPSRKFPCKHCLGLMLMHLNFESSFKQAADGQEADFVQEWLDKRAQNATKKEQKAADAAKAIADPKAKARRQASRMSKISGGIDLLETWLKDVIRTGMASGLESGSLSKDVSELVRRMVDAQAPGLASRLRKLNEQIDACLDSDAEDYEHHYAIVQQLSQLYLIVRSYRNFDALTPMWQAEIRRLIGINENKEEILALPGIEDQWLVLSDIITPDDKLTTHDYVMYGLNSQQFVHVFVFVPKVGGASEVYMVGHVYPGKMHMFPSVSKGGRAVFEPADPSMISPLSSASTSADQEVNAQITSKLESVGCADFTKFMELKCEHFATNPFAFALPVFVDNVRFARQESNHSWHVVDASGHALPLACGSELSERQKFYVALSLGRPFKALLVSDSKNLDLRGVFFEGRYYGE